MRHGAEAFTTDIADFDADLSQHLGKRTAVGVGCRHGKNHKIGLDRLKINMHTWQFSQALSQPPGGLVVFGQPLDHLIQGHDSCRSNNTGLAHPAADHFPITPSPPDKLLTPAHERADRSGQSFGQAKLDRIDRLG